MKPVKIDGGKDVGYFWSRDIELGKQFHLSAGDARIDVEFSRNRDEILLKDLQRHHTAAGAPMFGDERESPPLLCWGSLIVGVD